jgi:superfamily II helicase
MKKVLNMNVAQIKYHKLCKNCSFKRIILVHFSPNDNAGVAFCFHQKEDAVETLTSDEQMAQNIQSDVAMIDRLQSELRDLDKKINQQASMLSGGGMSSYLTN